MESRPTPAASPARGGSEAEHKPLAGGPGLGCGQQASSGRSGPGSGEHGDSGSSIAEPLELRVPEQRLQRDTHPAETAAHHLQGPTWHGPSGNQDGQPGHCDGIEGTCGGRGTRQALRGALSMRKGSRDCPGATTLDPDLEPSSPHKDWARRSPA